MCVLLFFLFPCANLNVVCIRIHTCMVYIWNSWLHYMQGYKLWLRSWFHCDLWYYGKMRLKQICSCKKLEKHHYNWNCSYWPFLNHGYMIWFSLLLYHLLMCFVHAFCCMKVLHHGFLIEHPLYVSFFGVERF